jgi:hypothetical protein
VLFPPKDNDTGRQAATEHADSVDDSARWGYIASLRRAAVSYIRCGTCGRYLSPESAHLRRYCGEECSFRYQTCQNCGRYFRTETGYSEQYCSAACAVRYTIHRLQAAPRVQRLSEELL